MAGQTVFNVRQFIDEQRVGLFQLQVLLLCACMVFFEGIDFISLSVTIPSLAGEWGVPASSFSSAFLMTSLGMIIGTTIAGMVADRLGRRIILILATIVFAAATLAMSLTHSLVEVDILRLITSIGLGGTLPCTVPLVAEYSPRAHRALMVCLHVGGYTLGAAAGTTLAYALLPTVGWRGIFVLVGLIPLVALPFVMAFLPESIQFLVATGKSDSKIRAILGRIKRDIALPANVVFTADAEEAPKGDVRALFQSGRALGTVLIWIMCFMSLAALNFFAAWFPALLRESGMSIEGALYISSISQWGGTFGVLVGLLIDWFGIYRTMSVVFLLGAAAVAALGVAIGAPTAILGSTAAIVGWCVNGAISGVDLLAANYYPTRLRATGVGWANGAGRCGTLVTPIAGAYLVSRHLPPTLIFGLLAIPLAINTVAVLISMLSPTVKAAGARAGERIAT